MRARRSSCGGSGSTPTSSGPRPEAGQVMHVGLGSGRGLARAEFDGFGVDMASSRRLFTDRAQAILDAFETGEMALDGRPGAPRVTPIRPAPVLPLRGRTYASSISPESQEIMA